MTKDAKEDQGYTKDTLGILENHVKCWQQPWSLGYCRQMSLMCQK